MKLVKIFSVLSLVVIAAACGSSQPVTSLGYNTNGVTGVYPAYPVYPGGSGGMVLIGGVKSTSANTLQASAYVNAGEKIYVNLTGVTYGVAAATCGHQWYNTVTIQNPPAGAQIPLTNISVTFNGSPVNGSLVAPSAGTVLLTANLDPNQFHIRCTDLYDNQTANIIGYTVNLSNVVTK